MCKEKPPVKREIYWDEVNERWLDWLGAVWKVKHPPVFKRDPLCDHTLARAFNKASAAHMTIAPDTMWFLLKSEEDDGTYTFRGDVDLAHLIHDCIRDYRFGFVAIGEKYTYMGLLTGILDEINHPDFLEKNLLTSYKDGYQIYKFNKSFTPQIVKWLPGAVATYRQVLKRKARKIRKRRGKLKGSPETKVMTY